MGMSTTMSDEKTLRKKLKEAFKDIDQNADGNISKDELEEFLSYKNMTQKQMDDLMNKMDLDQNGVIDVSFSQSLREAFENADKDKDGFISKDEIKYLMKYFFRCSDVENFMDNVDLDKDGKMNYKEFLMMTMESLRNDGKLTLEK